MGFYTTRYLESENAEKAETEALELLRQDDWLQSLKRNVVPEEPETRVIFEEIVEVANVGDGGAGFTFFPMNENSAN